MDCVAAALTGLALYRWQPSYLKHQDMAVVAKLGASVIDDHSPLAAHANINIAHTWRRALLISLIYGFSSLCGVFIFGQTHL